MPRKTRTEDIPSTLQRSPEKAQRTYEQAHDSAVESYGEGERAHRTAFAAVKHSFEKVGDHWEPKPGGRKGPSDEQAARDTSTGSAAPRRTHGGVDVKGHTKAELLDRAKTLGVTGRSRMSKDELATAIDKANQRETARARRS